MPQTNRKIDIKLIAPTAVFLGMLMILPTNISLSEPKTWENLVERKNQFFEKFTNTPFNGKIEVYWPNGHLKESGTIKMEKRIIFGNIIMRMETQRRLSFLLLEN